LSVFRIVSTANSEYLEGDEMAEFFVELPVTQEYNYKWDRITPFRVILILDLTGKE
jgi:hypothetical protein